ncbi:Metalloproteinase inhibitor 3 [Stylophora pistillata]|uniref:Metalloproteinase inhibitor 3 n=2 Tax=Stylophora pistillata TaxID=50429 RepID=A0A2B4SFW5_STYPI|nr:Metalloproteinase inhibitor 3 [Stylophora pistillata]
MGLTNKSVMQGMTHTMANVLSYITLLLCAIAINEACKCRVPHPQTQFCNADFAIRAKVLRESLDGDQRIYTLRVLRTFKGDSTIGRLARTQGKGKKTKRVIDVTTNSDTAACGVRLDISKVYLILGDVGTRTDRQVLTMHNCPLQSLWRDITVQRRRGLKSVYGRNCQCKIEKICYKSPPSLCDNMIGGCDKPAADSRVTYCRGKHSYCAKTGDKCRWILPRRADFQKCLQE